MKQQVSVENKVIFVTGAFGLIGETISRAFLEQGAKVILADSNAQRINSVETALTHFKSENYLITNLDITDENSGKEAIKNAIQKFGRIDVLINNAAIDAKFDKQNAGAVNHTRFENYPLDLFRRSVDVNITGTVFFTQLICRQMLLQGHGNIINVASTYSLVAPNQGLYDFGDGNIKYMLGIL